MRELASIKALQKGEGLTIVPITNKHHDPATSMLAVLLESGRALHGEALSVYAENYPYWDWSETILPWIDLAKGLKSSGYGDPLGSLTLREHLAARDAAKRSWPFLSPDNVAITQGGTHALYSILQILGEPNSDVLLPAPGYTGYRDICQTLKLKHRPYVMDDSQEWLTDDLLRSLRPSSIMIVNSPHNPSGTQIRTTQLSRLVQAARSAGSLVLFDVVYDDLIYEGDSPQWSSIFKAADDLASFIWVNSFSKNYAFPALRMGWVTATKATIRKLEPALESSILCLPSLNQELALATLRRSSGALLSEMNKRRNFLCDCLASLPDLAFKRPAAGVCVMACVRNRLAADLIQQLLHQQAALFLPGDAYYCGHPQTIRLSFGYPPAIIERYILALTRALAAGSSEQPMELEMCVPS